MTSARTTLLFLHAGDNWIRGSENVLLSFLAGLDRSRYRPVLLCNQEIMARAARAEAGTESQTIPIPEIMWEGARMRIPLLRWAQAVRMVREAVRREGAALLYCNGALTSQVGYFAARREGIPMVCHLHAPYTRRYAWLYRFHRADRTIFVSQFCRELLENRLSFTHPPLVILNGVDTERFSPPLTRDPSFRAALGVAPDDCVVGQVGSLIYRKGVDVAIRALAEPELRHLPVRLLFVGEGPDHPTFQALADTLGVGDRVHFVGQQNDAAPYYREIFDINLLASRGDALGLALLEGGASGLPGIGAAVEGTPEAMVDGVTGYLFQNEDHRALAHRIQALATNPELRRTMGAAARALALERFSMEGQHRSLLSVIEELLAPSPPPPHLPDQIL